MQQPTDASPSQDTNLAARSYAYSLDAVSTCCTSTGSQSQNASSLKAATGLPICFKMKPVSPPVTTEITSVPPRPANWYRGFPTCALSSHSGSKAEKSAPKMPGIPWRLLMPHVSYADGMSFSMYTKPVQEMAPAMQPTSTALKGPM